MRGKMDLYKGICCCHSGAAGGEPVGSRWGRATIRIFSRPSEEAIVNVDGPFPNFAVLSRIRKTLEMVRSPIDSPLYPLATNFFIRSPWTH